MFGTVRADVRVSACKRVSWKHTNPELHSLVQVTQKMVVNAPVVAYSTEYIKLHGAVVDVFECRDRITPAYTYRRRRPELS